jgi:hypothetical protein
MILSFQQKFPDGTPTYFIEKVWLSLFDIGRKKSAIDRINQVAVYENYSSAYKERFSTHWDGCTANPEMFRADRVFDKKLHSIRAGKRWKPGDTIHFAINPRSKNYFQFAPAIEVVSVQDIEIEWYKQQPIVVIDGGHFYNPIVGIDKGIIQLAKNDGFASVIQIGNINLSADAFFQWFNKDFTGQIVHWTDLRYPTPARSIDVLQNELADIEREIAEGKAALQLLKDTPAHLITFEKEEV